jgi:acetylornithine deacetylase/succinyl-diaminopimelate desuccinylase-like protein
MVRQSLLDDLPALTGESESWFRANLRTLVEHPTVSPGRPDDGAIRDGAVAAVEILRRAGAEAELVETSATPAVVGRFRRADPVVTVLCYNHLDVQPASADQWQQSDPFKFEVEEHNERGFLYRGRGATDDKGPALCALQAAVLVNKYDLPIEVRFVWESEEETGSIHFGEIVAAKREQLRCDAVIVSDTIWPHADQPAISTALRGLLLLELRLRTAAKQVHSGLTGGVARNPVRELCEAATAIHHASFWREGVVEPSMEEIEGYAGSGFDLEYFKGAHSLEKMETEVPLEMMLRLWARPTFEIHGVTGGYHGPGVKTVVPHAAELKASFRLVAGQNPARIANQLHEFLATLNPDIEVDTTEHLEPYRGADSGKFHDAVSRGMAAAFGRTPVRVREGGSIGAVPVMAEQLGVPVHFLPLSLPDHGYHAPNEYFDWRQARGGIEAFARTFAELATS